MEMEESRVYRDKDNRKSMRGEPKGVRSTSFNQNDRDSDGAALLLPRAGGSTPNQIARTSNCMTASIVAHVRIR